MKRKSEQKHSRWARISVVYQNCKPIIFDLENGKLNKKIRRQPTRDLLEEIKKISNQDISNIQFLTNNNKAPIIQSSNHIDQNSKIPDQTLSCNNSNSNSVLSTNQEDSNVFDPVFFTENFPSEYEDLSCSDEIGLDSDIDDSNLLKIFDNQL